MKTYIYINPITNKPYEFSNSKNESFCISSNEKQEDGSYLVKHYKPIVLEIEKYDIELLSKTYNPVTNTLE